MDPKTSDIARRQAMMAEREDVMPEWRWEMHAVFFALGVAAGVLFTLWSLGR